MSELYGSDAYAPGEIAQRIESVGVTKARLPTLPLLIPGIGAPTSTTSTRSAWARCSLCW